MSYTMLVKRISQLEAEVGRLREGQRTDSNSIVRLTTRIAEYQARVAELDYALDEAVKDLGNLVAAFNKTSPMEQPWGTKELAVIKGDLIRRYHTAHPDAEEGKR